MKTSFSKICLLGVLVPLLLATHAVGALITWQTPVNVNLDDPTQVLTNGTYVIAGSIFSEVWTSAPNTMNGVVFEYFENSHFTWGSNITGTFAFPKDSNGNYSIYPCIVSGSWDKINSDSPTQPCVIHGLTPGVTYQFQVWVGYSNPDSVYPNTNTYFSSSAPDGLTPSSAPNQSASIVVGNNLTNSPVSQYIVGTFTADGMDQNLYMYGDIGQGQIAAYSLFSVPEPQTWALAALGASAVLFRLRRKERSA